jgi:small subunit ribosomal protein S17e
MFFNRGLVHMGRIKSTAVKRLGDELIEAHKNKFSADFEKNKKALGEVKKTRSKKTRNSLAGYITKKIKQMEKPDT